MIRYKDLNFPKGLNLKFLLNFLCEEELWAVIKNYSDRSRKERKIILPSQSCLKKCVVYYLVEKHKDLDVVMEILRGKEKNLGNILLHKSNIKRLYQQRKLEILKEKKRDSK